MIKERELLNEVLEYFDPLGLNTEHCGDLPERIKELLNQPEQTEYSKKKKEPEIYFVKNEFGTLRPTFKNPKETPFWIDVLDRGGE